MAKESDEIVAKLGELQQDLRSIERRLASVEAELGLGIASTPSLVPAAQQAGSAAGASVRVAAYLGRSLLVLGGAFFIRAATEAQLLPLQAGVLLGIIYALFWIGLCDRAARAGKATSAHLHAAAGATVAFPLIWESSTRFLVLPPAIATLLLAVISSALLIVAWRHRLALVAWIGVLGASATTVVFFFTPRAFASPALFLVILGVAVYWLCRFRHWPGLTAWTALLADFGVLVVGTAALSKGTVVEPRLALAIQLLLFVLYTSSFLIASLRLDRRSGLFEALQLLLVTLVGFGGAVRVASILGGGALLAVATTSLVFALGGYVALLSDRSWLTAHPRSYAFFAGLVWVLAAAGAGLLIDPAAAGWALCTVLATLVATRVAGATLGLHAIGFVFLAAFGTDLLISAWLHLFAPARDALPTFTAIDAAVLVAALICALLPIAEDAAPWHSWHTRARAVVLALLLIGIGSLLVSLLMGVTEVDGAIDRGRVATLRTTVLALLVLVTAASSRLRPLRPATWLVYPLLVLTGVKLIVEDFFQSHPGQLGIALAVYAGALIMAPRLRVAATQRSSPTGDSVGVEVAK